MKTASGWLLCLAFLLAGCGIPENGDDAASQPTLTLFVAASLTDVAQALGDAFAEEHGVRVVCNFAGSGALAQQLLAAPRADLFLSASERWMDVVEEGGRLLPGSRRTLLSNQLVVIGHPQSDYALADPTGMAELPFAFLAVGDPASVPAGRYARTWLQSVSTASGSSVWEALEARLSPAPDVRSALTQVTGRRDVIGIVYRTDVSARPNEVRELYAVPVEAGPPIAYPAAILRESTHPDLAQTFLAFLQSPTARTLFEESGFTVLASQ